MKKEQTRILAIVSDSTFEKLRRSAATDGRGLEETRHVELVRFHAGPAPVHGPVDAAVLEPGCFADIASFRETYGSLGTRALVVARDALEEGLVLSALNPGDDIFRLDAVETQFPARLERILSGVRTSRIDMLTGLSNRVALFELAQAVLAEGVSPDSPLSVIIVDLDNFKQVNDSYGHPTGDQVIRAAADALGSCVPDALCIARYGGDEFLVLLRADRELARSRAETLRAAVAALVPRPGLHLTASLGAATATAAPGEFSRLVEAADRCVYAAKENGRNCLFDQGDFRALAASRDEDPDIVDYDNRVRVLTDRLAEYLSQRGRNLARIFRDEAERDGLTGIFNRRYFDRRIARELDLARRPDRPLSLVFLDLDDFGAVNRTYGFPAGDRLLTAVAGAISRSVRSTDWVARYGGEELCAVLPDTCLESAVVIAERILAEIRQITAVSVDGRSFGATASAGVVMTRGEDAGVPELLQRASDKVREAKRAGKNASAR